MPRRPAVRLDATVEARSNLKIVARERGKVVARREGHNIWLNLGRQYLAQLVAYATFGPDTTYRDDRIRYMGFGIGGNRQSSLGVANVDPCLTSYPGTNVQNDTTPSVERLERPVRVSGGSTPHQNGDTWLTEVAAPPDFPEVTQVKFSGILGQTDASYAPFLVVPLSEVMLFTGAADPTVWNNTGIAYDTFETISKTAAIDVEVAWTIRF